MKHSKAGTMLAIALAFGLSVPAMAQDRLELKTVVEKEERITTDDGETVVRLVPVESVVPGEEVVYTVSYSNVSAEPTDNIVITNPIPPQLTYVDGSAFGPGTEISFSIDGGETYAAPAELFVMEDGVQRPASAEDFTNIRWALTGPLGAGQQGFARFRARLN